MSAGLGVATGAMVALSCGECGIEFHVPAAWQRERREKGDNWYCPNGHCRVYRESDVDKLKRELAVAERRRQEAEARTAAARERRDALERSLRTVKGHQTRLKRRVAAGCCPCCRRSFQNLARHMQSQHPEFAGEGASE